MRIDNLSLPANNVIKSHVLSALTRYWGDQEEWIATLPIPRYSAGVISDVLRLRSISVPAWAEHCAVDGHLLVPVEACPGGDDWTEVDWWLAIFLLLECWHERAWEKKYGCFHSYSFRLKDWDARVWDRAWVNRMGLFLRAWAERSGICCEKNCFEALPTAEILMTHDVDAVNKTLPIRIKQGVFNFYNAIRCCARGDFYQAYQKMQTAWRFAFSTDEYWTFEKLIESERQLGIKAHFNFYVKLGRRNFKSWLFDPGYSIEAPAVRDLLKELKVKGAQIGLHPAYDAWSDSEKIKVQKECLEGVSGEQIVSCRQHWLRFSWNKTWSSQQAAGIQNDTTLMFNDRPGFRNSSALNWSPWCQTSNRRHGLTALPSVLMDSHFYDYSSLNSAERQSEMKKWVDEVRVVSGQVAVLWHPHTLGDDYGWGEGFQELLSLVGEAAV